MVFTVDLVAAKAQFPDYKFVKSLTPSAQKAAFHVKDKAGNDLCLKLIAPTYEMDRIQREIEAMQSIAHPNVVKLIEYTLSTTSGASRHFLVEEFIEGTDLAAQLGTPWPRQRVSRVFSQLCDGLSQCHLKHIVHRDLKPTNVRIRSSDVPVVIDFGLSRHLLLPDLTATPDGAQIGTPLYFSPEQFQGTRQEIDHRTDLFAVGVMIHESLFARHPFWISGMGRSDLQDCVCNRSDFRSSPDFLGLPQRWQLLLARMLEKTRVARINTASQAAAILRKLENV
jgi:serine/threonine protein kinase